MLNSVKHLQINEEAILTNNIHDIQWRSYENHKKIYKDNDKSETCNVLALNLVGILNALALILPCAPLCGCV